MDLPLEDTLNCEFCYPLEELVAYQTKNFSILYDPYPLTVGHLMVIPHIHYGCGGELEENLMPELLFIQLYLTQMMHQEFPHVVYYEHGRSGACLPSMSNLESNFCHHMHLHILPSLPLSSAVETLLPSSVRISYSKIPAFFSSKGSYLYLEESPRGSLQHDLSNALYSNAKGCVFPAHHQKIPSHFLRTFVAKINGTPERASWNDYPPNDLLKKSRLLFPQQRFSLLGECVNDLF